LTRGKYSPFGCDEDGSGGARFANHHRVSYDANHVQMQPLVTQLPRTWMGKRVGVWIHCTTDDGTHLNSKADAQLVFAGRLSSISDDSNSGETILEIDPLVEEIRNHVIAKEIWSAEVGDGLTLVEGRVFSFNDFKEGVGLLSANSLTVVAGAPASANQIQAGRYSLGELCSIISKWLASEKAAARIYGYYTLASPVETASGVRTRMRWRNDHASTIRCNFKLEMPGEVASFLGIYDAEPGTLASQVAFAGGSGRRTNTDNVTDGAAVPYVSIVFRPYGPGRIGQEFSDLATTYAVSHERGTFLDQYSLMPASIKAACVSGSNWGFFILDEKTLLVGSYEDGVLTNCWMPPFQLTADRETDASTYIGRRADDTEGGPVLLRQVFFFEASFSTLFLQLLFSTGTPGYSSATFDTLAYGLGMGIPGSLMGDPMIRTVENLPGADQTLGVFIDEPTRFQELFSGDFVIRRMFLRWKDQGIEACQWVSPTRSQAVATFEESNKAAPSNTNVNHRSPSVEAQVTQRPIVKIDFCPDFATGRERQYLKSIMFEDQVAVDDLGGQARIETIKLRNTFQQFANAGASIEALTSKFLEFFPCVSRPWRALTRSIDVRFYEGYSVGDVVLVNDAFARDPVTGQREIAERPAVITRHWYDWNGIDGGIELMFLDAQREGTSCPAAQVDDTVSAGGFSAGYNNGTATLRCYEQKFSHDVTIVTHGLESTIVAENADASHFDAGDKVLIYELDPADPASPDYWEREVLSQSGNDIVLTSTLSAPAWDANKKYAITFQRYDQVQTSQQDFAFQADSADFMVRDTEAPYHIQLPSEDRYYNPWEPTWQAAALLPNLYGDGNAEDNGSLWHAGNTLNHYHNYKSANSAPILFTTSGFGAFSGERRVQFIIPVFFGLEQVTSAVTRAVRVAPFFASSDGTAATVRVTLSRSLPQWQPSATPGSTHADLIFSGESSSASWTTTSTTYATGAEQELSLAPKHLQQGYAFLTVEVDSNKVLCYGLGRCQEGAKVIV
jgi:hypothetical protein